MWQVPNICLRLSWLSEMPYQQHAFISYRVKDFKLPYMVLFFIILMVVSFSFMPVTLSSLVTIGIVGEEYFCLRFNNPPPPLPLPPVLTFIVEGISAAWEGIA